MQAPEDACDELPLELLPPELRVVAEAAGAAAALRLVQERGGRRVYIPAVVEPGHWLVEIIGLEGLRALVEAYPSEPIEVSKAEAALRFLRDRQMRSERLRGATISEISTATRLSRRRVQQVLAEGCGQPPGDQADLFA